MTLEKRGFNQDHKYEDRFLAADLFQWLSQNKTKQDSKHGRLIKNHRAEGIEVHLFVRREKVLDGNAAPFVYCGIVDFVSWKGDGPITVDWKLREEVPARLHDALKIQPTSR